MNSSVLFEKVCISFPLFQDNVSGWIYNFMLSIYSSIGFLVNYQSEIVYCVRGDKS
jgi:hypothetical protein